MPVDSFQLSSNPFDLVRSFPTQMIPLKQIVGREGHIEDKLFTSRYLAFLKGKTPTHETRLSLDLIRRGCWTRSEDGWALIENPVTESDYIAASEKIRLGYRPVLHLYENPNPDDSKRFICSDDVVMHFAYEKLGLRKVPVVIMGKPRDLEESCLSIRFFPRKGKAHIPLLDGVVPVIHELVPSILGSKREHADSWGQLQRVLADAKCALKRFHQPGADIFHYHHTLYSVLARAEESIESMRLLIDTNRPLSAASLLRSLYELVLMFYVDWLSPGQFIVIFKWPRH